MCTVTFIPYSKGVLIASNRDEQLARSMAAMPVAYPFDNGRIVFPKDNKAGGTWIGMHENGHVMVLLNGAYQRHQMGGSYRRSRGLIFLDIFSDQDPHSKFRDIDLDNIEPFTLVLWANGRLWDLRWDGARKYNTSIDPAATHIWSSATLYTPEVRAQRELWFKEWQEQTDMAHVTIEALTAFHTFGGSNADEESRLVMHRGDLLETISITTIDWQPDEVTMHYHDLVHKQSNTFSLPVQTVLH